MSNYRSYRARSSSNERNKSEGLVDLHVYVIPGEQWKNHLTNILHRLVTDSISAGYIRVHPESLLSDIRQEINSQLGFDSVPRDYVFLRCLGRSFTQVKEKQERELKAKYFMPPHTYSPELYVLDASTAQRFSPSSQSSHQSFSGKQSSRALLSPPSYPAATTRTYPTHDHGYNDLEKASDILRQKPREEEWRRKQRPQEQDEEEEKRRRRLREEEEEDERTRRIIEELEAMRREELEQRRKANEADDVHRMRRLEEEEEEDRMRLRRLVEEEGRRGGGGRGGGVHLMESPFEEFSRPKTPSPTPRQRTFERHEPARDGWKKRSQEERRRPSPPRDDIKVRALKEELDNINRRITDHMETIRDGGRRMPHSQANHNDKAYNSKLQATQMEHEIEDLERKLQSTKLQLTAEMKLRNQCEQELLNLRSELEKLRANSLPRLEERVTTRIIEVPVYIKEPRKAETPPPPPPPEPIPPAAPSGALEEAFKVFATKNNGAEATGQDIFKWGADAGIIGKSMNNHHIDISFHKVKPKGMKTITLKELYPLVDELAYKYADDTRLSYQGARKRLIDRMANAPFKLHGATHAVKTGGVARLANGSKAPGSLKTRFHPSAGNGGGGRQDKEIILESREYNHKYN